VSTGIVPAMGLRRAVWGSVVVVALFAVFAGIGVYETGIHNGRGPTAATFEVTVRDDAMNPASLAVREGDQVVLSISSDRSETVSIRDYGLSFTLSPAFPVSATFIANLKGTHDIVLDRNGKRIGVLRVS
jgi:hypothetical protein